MADTPVDLLVTTISNTPSITGNFTISAAATRASSAPSNVTFGASHDGLTFKARIHEPSTGAWELRKGCTYTHSGTTLSRGTLEASSTGSAIDFTSAAIVAVVLTAAQSRKHDAAALENVAGSDANTTMAVNTLYVVDMSAWATADRTYKLPATAAVGDRVGVMVTSGNASYELILTAETGDTLNGVAGGTEWSRLFITNEVVIMRCVTADSTWIVEHAEGMKAYSFSLRQNGNTVAQQSLTANTWEPIEGDVLNTTVWNTGASLTNVGTGGSDVTFTARRAGRYTFGGLVIQLGGASSADKKVLTGIVVNSDTTDGLFVLSRGYNNISGGIAGFGGSQYITLAVGDTVVIATFAEDSGSVVNPTDNYALFWGRWEAVT